LLAIPSPLTKGLPVKSSSLDTGRARWQRNEDPTFSPLGNPRRRRPACRRRRDRRNRLCQAYLGPLATQLGVSQAKLAAASAAALKATIQDQVTSGKLTQAQADKIEAKLPATGLCSAAINGIGRTKAAVATSAYLTAAASALGVTEAQLKADLKSGQNLSQVAAAQKVSEADFKTRVTASIKSKLDAAVAAKAITQAQEDAQLAKLQVGDPPYWNSTHK